MIRGSRRLGAPVFTGVRVLPVIQPAAPGISRLVLGWGGGWHTKTLNRYLKRDPATFERLVCRCRLNPTGTHKPGAPFPKSRRLLRLLDKPGPPLGCVKVTLG